MPRRRHGSVQAKRRERQYEVQRTPEPDTTTTGKPKGTVHKVAVRPHYLRRSSSDSGSIHALNPTEQQARIRAAKARQQRASDAEDASILRSLASWVGRFFGVQTLPTQPMDRILPFLYIGSSAAAQDRNLLDSVGITHICNAAVQCENHFRDQFTYLHLHLEDSATQRLSRAFNTAADFIENARSIGGCVLVHCIAGASRSASLVVAYLMKHRSMLLVQAYDFVKRKRPVMNPSPAFRMELAMYEITLFESSSVIASTDPVWDFYQLNMYRLEQRR
ncbi:hypothetical protein AC1031_001360 [Aphanomyces cochlioides]|nr:hypothetical protein AC1031_001360 [Aphanomyces cochlioides]